MHGAAPAVRQELGALQPEDYVASPDRPVLIHQADCATASVRANTSVPVPFQFELFSGQVLIYIAGLPSTPASLFKHQRRRTHLVIQGHFREPLPLADVLTGQAFKRPLCNLSHTWLLQALCHIARRLSPGISISERSILSPLASAAQAIHVAAAGCEPALTDPPLEDMRLCGPLLASSDGEPLPMEQRRRLFGTMRQKVAGLAAWPGHVYTFHLWQHLLDVGSLQLATPLMRISLARHLDGQPLQLLARMRDGRRLWEFDMWHEALLPAARAHAKRAANGQALAARRDVTGPEP